MTPTVSSELSCLPEVCGDAALLVDPRDPEALASAIGRLLDDGALCERLRAAGYERARGYTWERSARAHLEVYRAAARRREAA